MLALAWPLALAELSWTMMGVVDSLCVGRLKESAAAIGAVSLGSILFYVAGIFGSGLLLGLDTLVSQSFGAGDFEGARRSLINALYLTPPLSALLMAALWACDPLLPRLGENPEVLRLLRPYLSTLTWSVPPLLVYFGLRRYLQAVNIVRPAMFALISANLVNLAGNCVLVYGWFGVPAMGVRGSACATLISRIYMALALVAALFIWDRPRAHWPLAIDLGRIAALLRLGLPAGGQILLETGIFAVSAVFIGRLDPASLAAHQIALNTASATFMVTFGISSAAAVRVGQALGRGDPAAAAISGWTALGLGIGFMACASAALLAFPAFLTRIYTPDPDAIRIGVKLLSIAAAFQIFDGSQVVLSGALRGAGDTHTPMFCHLAGYWFAGLPLGWLLCFRAGWGVTGIWTGLCLALILIASILTWVWYARTRSWSLTPALSHPSP